MAKKVGLEVSVAVGEAVKLADADVIAAYPITPQTHIVEHLAHFIPVESEHSAMSACLGSSAVGARTFTATASQGIALMHETLYLASSMRLPIVMAVANRALSAPISIWCDHSDAMSARDTGWIQFFVENGQEAVDSVICAFRMGEDQRVLLPVMIHMDGFHLTHVTEPIDLPEESAIARFLPPFNPPRPLDPEKPITMGAFASPFIYTEIKYAQDQNLRASKEAITECWQDFGKTFGRYYSPVEKYQVEGAKVLLMTLGSYGETAMTTVDKMRSEGKPVGLLKLRLWRPFPFAEFRQAVKDAEVLIVLDRALSFGGPGGPVSAEVRSALYDEINKPKVVGFVGGLGGRDISTAKFEDMIEQGTKIARVGGGKEFEMFEVRA
jgi:pyruvate ferredoxin oxidoreductase alpha subunit